MGLRSCAGAIGQILICKRSCTKKTEVGKWQFPQGGVQGEEAGLEAVYREIHEEVGLSQTHLELVYAIPHPLTYTFVNDTRAKNHDGQTVQWFVFYMKNSDLSQVYLKNEDPPEFDEVKWSDWDTLQADTVKSKEQMFKDLRPLVEPAISKFLSSVKKG